MGEVSSVGQSTTEDEEEGTIACGEAGFIRGDGSEEVVVCEVSIGAGECRRALLCDFDDGLGNETGDDDAKRCEAVLYGEALSSGIDA
jgi:hypothetical protein